MTDRKLKIISDDNANYRGSTVSSTYFVRRLILSVMLINLFVAAFAVISLSQSRTQYQRQAETTTQNLSRILDEYLAGTIDKINVALFAVSNEYEKQLAGSGINGQTLNDYIKREHSI